MNYITPELLARTLHETKVRFALDTPHPDIETREGESEVRRHDVKKPAARLGFGVFWRFHTTDPKDETTDTAGSQGVRVYQKS